MKQTNTETTEPRTPCGVLKSQRERLQEICDEEPAAFRIAVALAFGLPDDEIVSKANGRRTLVYEASGATSLFGLYGPLTGCNIALYVIRELPWLKRREYDPPSHKKVAILTAQEDRGALFLTESHRHDDAARARYQKWVESGKSPAVYRGGLNV